MLVDPDGMVFEGTKVALSELPDVQSTVEAKVHRDVAAECVAIDTLGDDMESVEPVELKDGEAQDD